MQKLKFAPENDGFYRLLKERVATKLQQHHRSRFANPYFFLKAGLLLGCYLLGFVLALLADSQILSFTCMLLLGPLSVLIGINIAHDGAHDSISPSRKINRVALQLLDLLGANSYIWKERHVRSHHLYPNVLDLDADMKQNPLVRIFPHGGWRRHHRYQFVYAPFLYLIYSLNWLLFRDFQDFRKNRIGAFSPGRDHRSQWRKMLVCKSIYFGYMLALPALFSALSVQMVLFAWILQNVLASLLITVALLPSHVAEDSSFPLPGKDLRMSHSWSHHQMLTVTDFATDSWLLNTFFGGFNHHITHHLFPGICHIHYPLITPVIKQTAQEFGLPYQYQGSLFKAYRSHIRLLKNNGKAPAVSLQSPEAFSPHPQL